MYAYRSGNGLMTNLDSISSSLSSIDTIGQRANIKASVDKLITSRTHSITSTSLLWKGNKPNGSINRQPNNPGSEIYYNSRRNGLSTCCLNLETALHFILVPLLLLVITRQVFDFLGQIWLQIIINFFTTLLIIVALFGVRQSRLSYIGSFTIWALFNTVWNLVIFCIHSKAEDVGITEDALSFFTGSVSWWHSNGPGCLPYNFNPNQAPTLSIIQPNNIPGCRLDYHLIESTQAIIHAILSFLAVLISCCVLSNIRKEHAYLKKQQNKSFRLNNLTNERNKINQDPFPDRGNSRYGNSSSLRRAANLTSSRSSQHSVASARRRNRQSTDSTAPTPRESVSSMHKSQKYGSLSSRRSGRKERRGEVSSLTYGTTGVRAGSRQRNRLSSMSSNDYLPSYQPPSSSNANLLSSYGEISSIDSYNNGKRGSRSKPSGKSMNKGNANPTYNGSRSSVCSQNAANYDDLSYIYGNNGTKNSDSVYGPSTSGADAARQKRQMYNRGGTLNKRNGISEHYQSYPQQQMQAEDHQEDANNLYQNGDTTTNPKTSLQNNNLHSFAAPNSKIYSQKGQANGDYGNTEINNNHIMPNLREELDQRGQTNGTFRPNLHDNRSRQNDSSLNSSQTAINQNRIYSTQRSRHPIYLNHVPNGNSETPI